jgi:hypothetical protein
MFAVAWGDVPTWGLAAGGGWTAWFATRAYRQQVQANSLLQGELILTDRDPLPLLIGEGVTDDDAISAWTCALLGFADATCIELEQPKSATLRARPIPQPRLASSPGGTGAYLRTLPRRRSWPSYLEPVGHWIQYSGAFVAGHRRRLQDGQQPATKLCPGGAGVVTTVLQAVAL